MKVLVTGGRDFEDWDMVCRVLDQIHDSNSGASRIELIINGGATGADTLSTKWALSRGVSYAEEKVTSTDWLRLGKKAGPLRNQRMIDVYAPDLCVAFPGGRGTADCVERAQIAKIPIHKVAKIHWGIK